MSRTPYRSPRSVAEIAKAVGAAAGVLVVTAVAIVLLQPGDDSSAPAPTTVTSVPTVPSTSPSAVPAPVPSTAPPTGTP